jgi:hypothetical protein
MNCQAIGSLETAGDVGHVALRLSVYFPKATREPHWANRKVIFTFKNM